MVTAFEIETAMRQMADTEQQRILSRFFKTGEGEYGAGDVFLGIKVPQTRAVVKEARLQVPLTEIETLLQSPYHEVRLCGFLLLVEEMNAAMPRRGIDSREKALRRAEIANFYIANARQANNWDLVDLSCYKIVGQWLLHPQADGTMPGRDILDTLARSDNLWEQRIAIVSTMMLIRAGQYDDTLRIATLLLGHPHDLIHKAIGWMLREIGKRDLASLAAYLDTHYSELHRTTLRYAIERLDPAERQAWLSRR